MSLSGKVLDGRYQILQRIGHGASGDVWLAVDLMVNGRAAVKKMKKQNEAEAGILMRLKYPGITAYRDTVMDAGERYLIMEYIEGCTMEEYLQDCLKVSRCDVLRWGLELVCILQYMHTQCPPVIHCDIKPGNIMITADGHLKLIDFGIAREIGQSGRMCMAYGSVGYAAPEQYGDCQGRLQHRVDERADVYAFGRTMLYILRYSRNAGSIGVRLLLRRCVRRNPQRRYRSAAAVRQRLQCLYHVQNFFDRIAGRGRSLYAGGILTALCVMLFFGLPYSSTEEENVDSRRQNIRFVVGGQEEEAVKEELQCEVFHFYRDYSELEQATKTGLAACLRQEDSPERYRMLLQYIQLYASFQDENEEACRKMNSLLETGIQGLGQLRNEDTGNPLEQQEYIDLYIVYELRLFRQYRLMGQKLLQDEHAGALQALNQAVMYGEELQRLLPILSEESAVVSEDLNQIYQLLGETDKKTN